MAQDADIPEAEVADLTVAIPFPDIVMYSRYYIADALGYLDEEGITIEVVTADDPVAAVLSGSADIGVQSAGAAVLAADEGLDLDIIGSHSCRQSFSFATQPDITSVEDLAGKDIVMAGTPGDPAQFERERVLREAGWDISTVDANVVYPGPDSATWRQFFLAGNVAMMPFYSDDQAALEEYGASFPVSELKNWPNDVYVTRDGWSDENPGSATRFLRAVMEATDFLQAPVLGEVPANKDQILEIYRANDYEALDEEANPGAYSLNSHNYCDNLYYDADAMATTIDGQGLEVDVTFDDVANLGALEAAQASLGKGNEPPAELPWP
jgi:NitT/TauT family transport system substrate-binding protein